MTSHLEVSRWPGGPLICDVTNLPSHASKSDALTFHERNAPGQSIGRIGPCHYCGGWHYESKVRPPSGASSGTGRK